MSADLPPQTPVEPARRSLLERLSIVWVIPAVALAIALGVAWNSYAERGPLLELTFESATGIQAGQTELRYREVAVGLVEAVTFTEGLGQVLVSVRLDKKVASYVDADAQFWVVQPRVTLQGVSGLGTVLSGVYIEGIWDDVPGGFIARHAALADAPLNFSGRSGLALRLRAVGDTGISEGAPIVYRGVEVGRIGRAEVSADGSTVEADAIVFAPHDRMITSATRFWDSSGLSFSLGPGGVQVGFSSLSTLLSGGVTFETLLSGGTAVEPGTGFDVYPNEGDALTSIFTQDSGPPLTLVAIFEENVPGLSVGAPVDMGGLRIGKVTAISGLLDTERFGDDRVRLAAALELHPGRLGLGGAVTAEEALDYLDGRVAEGLRARLVSASILTGGLKVELVELRDMPPARIGRTEGRKPEMPTTAAEISDVSRTAEGLYERLNGLPIEEVMQSAIDALNNVSRLAGSDEIRAVPGEVLALVDDARGLVGSEDAQALPERVAAVAAQLETLTAALNENDAAGRLSEALESLAAAAQSFDDATAGVPELVSRLSGVAKKVEALSLEELVERASTLLDSADGVIDSDEARALPADLSAALEEVRRVLSELREGGLVENANATLASARAAADDIALAARDVPEILNRAASVLDEAAATLRGYDAARGIGRDLDMALREVERAARAVTSLANALERNPNSLLFGR